MATKKLPTEALHLCRSLLREASYLPDDAAKKYIHKYTISRFRNHGRPFDKSQAHKALHVLQRASNGEHKGLWRLLMLTYGRAGRRRRELLDQMRVEDEKNTPKPTTVVEDHLRKALGQSPKRPLNQPYPKLEALLKSHANQPFFESVENRGTVRRTSPKLPTENIWGRPLPKKREKGLIDKFWADTLDKVLPPLPEQEWHRLRQLAVGEIKWPGAPARRSRIREEEESLLDLKYLTTPISAAVAHNKLSYTYERKTPREINARTMQRLWAKIWNMSPMMTRDTEMNKWVVTWGEGLSAASRGEISRAGLADLELFAPTSEGDVPVAKGRLKRRRGRK